MAKKNKTKEVIAFDPNELERIKVEDTKKVNIEDLDCSSDENDFENMSTKELEYRLEFEETNPKIIKKIKNILSKRK